MLKKERPKREQTVLNFIVMYSSERVIVRASIFISGHDGRKSKYPIISPEFLLSNAEKRFSVQWGHTVYYLVSIINNVFKETTIITVELYSAFLIILYSQW